MPGADSSPGLRPGFSCYAHGMPAQEPGKEAELPTTPSREPTLEGAFAPDGVDLTVIRWMLSRSPTERLQAVQDLVDLSGALSGHEEN